MNILTNEWGGALAKATARLRETTVVSISENEGFFRCEKGSKSF